MLEFFLKLDESLFLSLNSLGNDLFDPIMLAISYNNWLIASLIIFLLTLSFRQYKKHTLLVFFFALVSFGLSDSISSRIFKPNFERLRPCHAPHLESKVYTAKKVCGGGKYGFVSSHASNSFAIAFFFWSILGRGRIFGLFAFTYAVLVSYSRIYLARHYPGDLIFGALLGLLCAFFSFRLFQKARSYFLPPQL